MAHMQQGTFNNVAEGNINNAISGVWERGGFARIRSQSPTTIDVCATADVFPAIREFIQAGAPADQVMPGSSPANEPVIPAAETAQIPESPAIQNPPPGTLNSKK